jgi:hypothetical protein
MAVKVLSGAVVAHGGSRVGVAGGDLYVAQVDTSVEHRGDEGMPDMCGCIRGNLTPACSARRRSRRVAQCRSIRVPREVSRIGPAVRLSTARSMARPTAGGSGTRTTLPPLPCTRRTRWPCSSPRSPMSLPVVSKIRRPRRPNIVTSAKSQRLGDCLAAVSRASNCRCVKPKVGDSAGTCGRRMYSAGECSSTPSITHVR